MENVKIKSKLRWGYALPWYGPFMKLDTDQLYAKLKFLKAHNLKNTGVSISEIDKLSKQHQERLWGYLEASNLDLVPEIGYDYIWSSDEEIKRNNEEIISNINKYAKYMRTGIVHTGSKAGHRFDRKMPLDEKLERLSKALGPIATACKELRTPLCIENHGDFYCSDLVKLCKETPELYMFLDTGNVYLIGEQAMTAFELAAPYTVGTHFKDHHVRPCPDARPLHFEVAGSAIGEGDVPLKECYDLLMKYSPNPDKLVMMMEMISPDDMEPTDCLNRSINFVNSLEG